MSLESIPVVSGAVPIAGHAFAIRDRFAVLDRITREVTDVGRLRFPSRDAVVVNSPESVHEVLVAKARSFIKTPIIRAALFPLAGNGLFTSEADLWRRQRRLMAPLFQPSKLDVFAPAMVECAKQVCDGWQDGAEIDIAAETTRITLNVAGRTLFGTDMTAQGNAIGEALTTALHYADTVSTSVALAVQVDLRLALQELASGPSALRGLLANLARRLELPLSWHTAKQRDVRAARQLLEEHVRHMIEQRRARASVQSDLLSRLLDARDEQDGSRMTDQQLRDEVLTLLVAGHETTANGLAWSMYALARDPALYRRARACVDALEGRAAGVADLERLSFLSCVFKEALRLYPPLYLFGRMATEEVVIGGYTLPRHSQVLISPWSLQRRADLWPDPLRFDPDRFANLDIHRGRGTFIAFSGGPRVCIGAYFALLEAPLVLATMLQRADFSLLDANPIAPEACGSLRPKGGVPARVRLRTAVAMLGPELSP